MSMSRGYRLPVKVVKQRRPFGIALFAGIGVLGGLVLLLAAVIGVWMLMRVSVTPSVQLAVLALILICAILVLWVNWGVWEMLRWAWWANVLLAVLGIAAAAFALRYVPAAADGIHNIRLAWPSGTIATVLHGVLLGSLAYQLLALVYMIGARAVFGVGVPDERPLWEKVHRF